MSAKGIAIQITRESIKPVQVPVIITLPGYMWQVIEAKADAHNGGNMSKAVQEIFESGLDSVIKCLGPVPTKEQAEAAIERIDNLSEAEEIGAAEAEAREVKNWQ